MILKNPAEHLPKDLDGYVREGVERAEPRIKKWLDKVLELHLDDGLVRFSSDWQGAMRKQDLVYKFMSNDRSVEYDPVSVEFESIFKSRAGERWAGSGRLHIDTFPSGCLSIPHRKRLLGMRKDNVVYLKMCPMFQSFWAAGKPLLSDTTKQRDIVRGNVSDKIAHDNEKFQDFPFLIVQFENHGVVDNPAYLAILILYYAVYNHPDLRDTVREKLLEMKRQQLRMYYEGLDDDSRINDRRKVEEQISMIRKRYREFAETSRFRSMEKFFLTYVSKPGSGELFNYDRKREVYA